MLLCWVKVLIKTVRLLVHVPQSKKLPTWQSTRPLSQRTVRISTLVFKLFNGDLFKTAKATELHPSQLPEKPLHIGQLNVSNGQTDVVVIQTVYLTHFVLSTFLFWTFGLFTININQKFLKIQFESIIENIFLGKQT